MVAIIVDDCGTAERQSIMPHRELLCCHSPYFHKAFKGDFRESEEKAVYLCDVTASTLRIFQSWLYGQMVRADPENPSERDRLHCDDLPLWADIEGEHRTVTIRALIFTRTAESIFDTEHRFVVHLARLYAFAEVYDTPQLRCDVMVALGELVACNENMVSATDCLDAVRELCDAVPLGAPIFRFLIMKLILIGDFTSEGWREQLENLPAAILVDFIEPSSESKIAPFHNSLEEQLLLCCEFHDHEDDDHRDNCETIQIRDMAFYRSFARACMNEVYAIEDGEAEHEEIGTHKRPKVSTTSEDHREKSKPEAAKLGT